MSTSNVTSIDLRLERSAAPREAVANHAPALVGAIQVLHNGAPCEVDALTLAGGGVGEGEGEG